MLVIIWVPTSIIKIIMVSVFIVRLNAYTFVD